MPTFPKPEARKKTKARQDRYARGVVDEVRREVMLRDGGCRFRFHPELGRCNGVIEWAHLWTPRAHTRGMPPEERHRSDATIAACVFHHNHIDGRQYPKLLLKPITPLKANGPLHATRTDLVHGEAVTTVCTVEIPSQFT